MSMATIRISETDALGRLQLDTLGAPHAIAASLIEHETTFGVLVLLLTVVSTLGFGQHYVIDLVAAVPYAAAAQASSFDSLAG